MITDYKLDPPDDVLCILCGEPMDEEALTELVAEAEPVVSDQYCSWCKKENEEYDD